MATRSDSPGDKLADTANDIRGRAAEGAESLKRAAEAKAEATTAEFGNRVDRVADAVHSAGDSLRGQEDWLADAADHLSNSIHDMSSTVRAKGFNGLKADVEQFAHERPLVFMGAAVAVGLAIGRLMRSSPPGARVRDDIPGLRDSDRAGHATSGQSPASPGPAANGAARTSPYAGGPDANVGDPYPANTYGRGGTA